MQLAHTHTHTLIRIDGRIGLGGRIRYSISFFVGSFKIHHAELMHHQNQLLDYQQIHHNYQEFHHG